MTFKPKWKKIMVINEKPNKHDWKWWGVHDMKQPIHNFALF